MDNKFELEKINDGKFGVVVRTDGSLQLKRSGREWVFFWQGTKQPVDLREALIDMAEELHDLRKLRHALLTICNCDLPFGRLVGFMDREDADNDDVPGSEEAYEFIAHMVEPVVRAEDESEGRVQFKWVMGFLHG